MRWAPVSLAICTVAQQNQAPRPVGESPVIKAHACFQIDHDGRFHWPNYCTCLRDCIASDYFGTRSEYGVGSRNPVYEGILDACEGAGYLDNDKLERVVLAAASKPRRCPSDYVYCESRCLSCA